MDSSGFLPEELNALDSGYRMVAGMDEAGRGPLAGPVTVGLVVFPEDILRNPLPADLQGVGDSKKLTEKKREKLFQVIPNYARAWAVVHSSNRLIDSIGINPATELALIQAYRRIAHILQLDIAPDRPRGRDMLLVDGNYKFKTVEKELAGVDYRTIVKGDSLLLTIAAASIMAKVSRDHRMVKYAAYFSDYELEKHKGYGTAKHRELIKEHGYSSLHRKSYVLKS